MAKEYVLKYRGSCDECNYYTKYAKTVSEAETLLKTHRHYQRVIEYFSPSPWDSRTVKKITQ